MNAMGAADPKYQEDGVVAFLFSLNAVQGFFCLGVFISLLRTYKPLVKFYEWFSKSGFEFAKYRGYGQTASKMYGFVPAPLLSVPAMRASGIVLMVSLCCLSGMSFSKLAPFSEYEPQSDTMSGVFVHGVQMVLLVVCGISYHLYMSQLYCEAHVGAHVTVFLPPFFFLLACYHAASIENLVFMEPAIRNATDRQTQVLFAFLLKLIIAASYCGAGISKLSSTTVKVQENGKRTLQWWWEGATLQACILEALFLSGNDNFRKHSSFGVPTPYSHWWQKFAFRRPRLLCAMSVFSVLFEVAAPLILCVHLLPRTMSTVVVVANIAFGMCGLGFHYGIAMLQNVDFISWWGPAYAVFFFDPAGSESQHNDLQLSVATYASMAAYMYVAGHLAFLIILRFTGREMIPFSAFKMFCDLKNIFEPSKKKWLWMSEKEHATGTLKNYCFPFCRPQHVKMSELNSLDFAYLVIGTGGIVDNKGNDCGHQPVCVTVNGTLDSISRASEESTKPNFWEHLWDKVANRTPATSPLKEPFLNVGDQNLTAECAPITIYTNVHLTENMYQLIYRLHEQGMLGAEKWMHEASIEGALKLVEDLRAEFRNCDRLPPLAKMQTNIVDPEGKLMGA